MKRSTVEDAEQRITAVSRMLRRMTPRKASDWKFRKAGAEEISRAIDAVKNLNPKYRPLWMRAGSEELQSIAERWAYSPFEVRQEVQATLLRMRVTLRGYDNSRTQSSQVSNSEKSH